jgi:sugar/nucleoside kinase (ribokinase family)
VFDATALGELLIDFTPSGLSLAGNTLFECNPGGAPANVLAVLSRLGKKTAFIGKIGNDGFGKFLNRVLSDIGINTENLVFTGSTNTTLAFVHLTAAGDRSFSFYRNPGADMLLDIKEVNTDIIKGSRVFHFGSVSMTHDPSRSATLFAAKFAKENGLLVSYDPNLRPALWENSDQAREVISEGLLYTDILKLSYEELFFLTGSHNLEEGSQQILDRYATKLIFITLGPGGCFYRAGKLTGLVPVQDVKVVDTTGAGDAFLGSALYKMMEKSKTLEALTAEDLQDIAVFANTVAAMVTMKSGAIPAIPTMEEIKQFMNRY